MRTLRYPAGVGGRARGRIHGESFAGEIRSLAELRTHLCRIVGGFASDADVAAAAALHLPVLADFDSELSEELLGIAEASQCSPEAIVILNHYTDLRDLGRSGHLAAKSHSDMAEAIGGDGCTVIWADSAAGPVLAQTWDMHASATPYVIALETTDVEGQVSAVLLSLTRLSRYGGSVFQRCGDGDQQSSFDRCPSWRGLVSAGSQSPYLSKRGSSTRSGLVRADRFGSSLRDRRCDGGVRD